MIKQPSVKDIFKQKQIFFSIGVSLKKTFSQKYFLSLFTRSPPPTSHDMDDVISTRPTVRNRTDRLSCRASPEAEDCHRHAINFCLLSPRNVSHFENFLSRWAPWVRACVCVTFRNEPKVTRNSIQNVMSFSPRSLVWCAAWCLSRRGLGEFSQNLSFSRQSARQMTMKLLLSHGDGVCVCVFIKVCRHVSKWWSRPFPLGKNLPCV